MPLKVDKSLWNKIKSNVLSQSDEALKIGFFDKTYGSENDNLPVATVASWMEHGNPRDYPPRPFFRVGFLPQLAGPKYKALFQSAIKSVMEGNTTLRAAYMKLGPTMVVDLKSIITAWSTPPNSSQTVEKKGFNDPLIETGFMRDSVEFRIGKVI